MFTRKKTEVEFKGVSASNEKRNAIILFVIEAVVVLIFVSGVLFALNYFGVINIMDLINQNNNNVTSQIPEKARPKDPKGERPTNTNFRNTESLSVEPSIALISDIDVVILNEGEKSKLLEFIDKYQVFGKKYLLKPGEFSDFVEELELRLTDQLQPNNKYFLGNPTSPVISSMVTFEGRKLILSIYLSQEAYNNDKITPEMFFMQSLLSNIYQMSKDPSGIGLNTSQQKELNDEISKLYLDKTEYLEIVRK